MYTECAAHGAEDEDGKERHMATRVDHVRDELKALKRTGGWGGPKLD